MRLPSSKKKHRKHTHPSKLKTKETSLGAWVHVCFAWSHLRYSLDFFMFSLYVSAMLMSWRSMSWQVSPLHKQWKDHSSQREVNIPIPIISSAVPTCQSSCFCSIRVLYFVSSKLPICPPSLPGAVHFWTSNLQSDEESWLNQGSFLGHGQFQSDGHRCTMSRISCILQTMQACPWNMFHRQSFWLRNQPSLSKFLVVTLPGEHSDLYSGSRMFRSYKAAIREKAISPDQIGWDLHCMDWRQSKIVTRAELWSSEKLIEVLLYYMHWHWTYLPFPCTLTSTYIYHPISGSNWAPALMMGKLGAWMPKRNAEMLACSLPVINVYLILLWPRN